MEARVESFIERYRPWRPGKLYEIAYSLV